MNTSKLLVHGQIFDTTTQLPPTARSEPILLAGKITDAEDTKPQIQRAVRRLKNAVGRDVIRRDRVASVSGAVEAPIKGELLPGLAILTRVLCVKHSDSH